jgi:cyanophycinase
MTVIKHLCCLLLLWTVPLFATGYLCAVGGGTENRNDWSDAPYSWMVQKADSGTVLVMHYDRGSSWLEHYFKDFGASDASSLVISSRTAAQDSAHYQQILDADMIFLRGGDQYRYYQSWNGTLVETAIRKVFDRGGVVGGSSAGLAVIGGVDYVARYRSAVSRTCLANPFDRNITLEDDFLPLLPGVIFDSHFTARGRHGRLLSFIAQWNETTQTDLMGIGVDEHTAVCVHPDGMMEVMGAGTAVVIHETEESMRYCRPAEPLELEQWTLHSLTAGFQFDLNHRLLVKAPEGAIPLTPQPQPVLSPRATLNLDGSLYASDARPGLNRLCDQVQPDTIVVISKRTDSDWTDLANSLICGKVVPIGLEDSDPADPALASHIRHSELVVMGGVDPAGLRDWWEQDSATAQALGMLLQDSTRSVFISGNAIQAPGDIILTNITRDRYSLQNGWLHPEPGCSWLHPLVVSGHAFESDDYTENRIGGFFYKLFQNRKGLGFLLHDRAIIELDEHQLRVRSDYPAIVIDLKEVSIIDSSDYHYRYSYPSRQSVAVVNASLSCITSRWPRVYHLDDRTWSRATTVEPERKPAGGLPRSRRLDIHPNPGKNRFRFSFSNTTDQTPHQLEIYDLLGRQVQSLPLSGDAQAVTVWTGRDRQGRPLPSGLYLAVVRLPQPVVRLFSVIR